MSDKTGIEWTDATWNPVTGCTKLSPASPGCTNCYASTFAERFRGTSGHYFEHGFDVQLRPDKLDQPLRWRRPRRIFVNSMSDLFHDSVPDEYIAQVFAVMAAAPRHTFQVLTKRHARMRSLLNSHAFWTSVLLHLDDLPDHYIHTVDGQPLGANHPLPNVWLGVSTENQRWADIRIPALLDTPAAVRFISAEPLLGPIDLDIPRCDWHDRDELWKDHNGFEWCQRCTDDGGRGELSYRHWLDACPENDSGINWVIVGGESGPGARPMHPDWARSLRDQCTAAGVPFLFKQWGEWGPAPWKIQRQADEFTLDYKARAEATCATHAFTGGMYQDDDDQWHENFMKLGHQPWSLSRGDDTPPYAQGMRKWGKKNAGRELDGNTWDQYPDTTAAVTA